MAWSFKIGAVRPQRRILAVLTFPSDGKENVKTLMEDSILHEANLDQIVLIHYIHIIQQHPKTMFNGIFY